MALKFKGVDFIEFDSLLSDDERLVRDSTRKFIENEVVPIIEPCNREGRFPTELVKPMDELGFYGATIKTHGCPGMSTAEYRLTTQEPARVVICIRSLGRVRSWLSIAPTFEFGSDAQKDKWL